MHPPLCIEGYEDDFVAGGDAAVPGAVKGNEETMILLWKLCRVIKSQAERCRVRLHLDQRLNHAIAGTRRTKIGIDDIPRVAARPTIVAAIL